MVTTQQGTVLRSRNPSVVGGVDGLSALLRGPQGRCPCCAWTTLPAAGLQGSPESSVRSQKQIKKKKKKIVFHSVQFSSVQLLSHVRLFATPWTATCQASLSITNSWSLLKLMPTESVMPSNHLILCHPLLLLPLIFSIIEAFSNESVLCNR